MTLMDSASRDLEPQIDAARRVLYILDDQGNIVDKTRLYKQYEQNATAYAMAKKDYADAQAKALADPALASTWPLAAVSYQQKVDNAWNTLNPEGAEKVERAVDLHESTSRKKG